MLAVAAIISILLALTVPVVGAFTSTAGRKGAVNILMNTLEQARVAALESGRDVHVIFWRREFPEKDAVMVVREPETGSSADPYELLTRWIEMPKGVIFYEGKKNGILDGKSVGNFLVTRLPKKQEPSGLYDVLTFNGSGVISYPGPSKTGLMLFVSEGVRGTGGTEAIIANRKDQVGGFEIISLRRFTGRASLEVSTLPGA
jgi:type II secretory pathway pseudopilin PulG